MTVSARVTVEDGDGELELRPAGFVLDPTSAGPEEPSAAHPAEWAGDRLCVEFASLGMLVEGSSSNVVLMGEADTVHSRMLDAKLLSSASAPVVTKWGHPRCGDDRPSLVSISWGKTKNGCGASLGTIQETQQRIREQNSRSCRVLQEHTQGSTLGCL